MRTEFCSICFLFLFLFTWVVNAQNSPDCRTAIPVCADQPVMGLANGSGDIDDFDPDVITETGCLEKGSIDNANIEHNTSWFVFRAGTGGQVGFDLEALPTNGGTGTTTAEWDFAVYGPDVNCADISNGTAQPIRCNYEVNDTRYTGLGVNPENGQQGASALTGSQNTYDDWLDVAPGEIYYILINNYNDNFNGDPEPFMLTFTGSSVASNQDTALDCTLRDEFLGLDINACAGSGNITLSALNSVAGPDIASVVWTVDYEDDGIIDDTLVGTGDFNAELEVVDPVSGRYFAEIITASGTPPTVIDEGGILITFYATPVLDRVEVLDNNLSIHPDQNNVEFFVATDGDYEYAINGGEFQDESVFMDIPPGENTLIINDKNGCGVTNPIPFLVIGYPKFFSPNGDRVNDTWSVKGVEQLTDPIVFIFDRYGKLLKQLVGDSSWDGTYNGKLMTSTDYWFRLEYANSLNGAVVAETRKTHFTLKR